ncbi:hypothetical protein MFIFM68171_08474 [Madurella fahalii]|uniref:Uncharacterized protein n=1 Tax=Madurella fahalii TaxID=1157608 RepID=A0ABQ0GKI0_9PEZI
MATINIPAVARSAITLIDSIVTRMRGWIRNKASDVGYVATLNKHITELNEIREFVSFIQKQPDEQTPQVGAALVTLESVARRFNCRTPRTINDVTNLMKEMMQARDALRRARPGDIHLAQNNDAKGGKQVNGALGVAHTGRRLVVEATGNTSENAFQLNAPVYGNSDDFAKMMAALNGVGA